MAYLSFFPYSAADYRARQAGLVVLGCHYCPLPDGIPSTDRYGNYQQAQRVWIGPADLSRESIGTAQAAYATVVQSIHTQATPDMGTVLANIRRALLTVDQYPTREDYISAMQPYWYGDPLPLGNSWEADMDCALRARQVLPADLTAWLLAGPWVRW